MGMEIGIVTGRSMLPAIACGKHCQSCVAFGRLLTEAAASNHIFFSIRHV